jgi:fructokinase
VRGLDTATVIALPARRIGIDLGGTKIEGIVLDDGGRVLAQERVATPRDDYAATIAAVRDLVLELEARSGGPATVGIGMPGSISPATGLVRNANSVWLNGRPFDTDVSHALARTVRTANDANCFALSEAVDGAGAGSRLVFGVILGTGVGGGLVFDGRLWEGHQGIAGEWGHNELPRRTDDDLPAPACWCGRAGCIETYLSGPALAASQPGRGDARRIVAASLAGDASARSAMHRFHVRLAKALAMVVNLVDPDVIVIGGGLSNIASIYEEVPKHLPDHVFADRVDTAIVRNRHGDSSGVRGAAWLWPPAAR